MSSSGGNPSGGASWRGLWPVAAIVVVASVLAFFLIPDRNRLRNGGPQNPNRGSLTTDECERLTSQLNETVGNLEAGQLQKAEGALAELVQKLPNEPAAVRNLAICRVLAFTASRQPGEDEPPIAPVQSALDAARKLEPRSPVSHILAARVAAHRQDPETAVAELEAAAKLTPDNPAIWYEIFDVGRSSNDDHLRQKSREAISAALQSAPTNSYLLKEELVSRAAEKDKRSVETVKALMTAVEPILHLVRRHIDMSDYATQFTDAVESDNWPVALVRARAMGNVIAGEEWVRSDLRRLKRHPLAYVALDFSPELCGRAPPFADVEQRLPIKFQAASSPNELPQLASVKALHLSDFDVDGLTDVVALTEDQLAVISRPGTGRPWTTSLTVAVRTPMQRLLVADLDRDVNAAHAKPIPERAPRGGLPSPEPGEKKQTCQAGDEEVVVFGPAGVQVFQNDFDSAGKRILTPVEQSEEFEALREVRAGVLADIDHDGDLDLILSAAGGISIWLNAGKLKFEEATRRSALPPSKLQATSLVAVDWDRDLDTDIVIAGPDDVPAGWLENLRHGSMRWREFDADLAKLTGSRCLNVLDCDGNASWDVVGAGSKGLILVRTRTASPGDVKPIDVTQFSKDDFTGSLVGDFDNDTYPDLLAWGPAGLQFFRGTPTGKFGPPEGLLQPPPGEVLDCAAADMDDDGDLDLVIGGPAGPVLFNNVGGNTNHWLAVRAMGDAGDNQNTGDVNHLAVGSVLELKTGRRYQAQIVAGQVTHFGLGKKKSADVLRVVWTNGVPQPAVRPEADTTLCRVHVIGSSCPYFYTWNGDDFAFCTDACWAAPLGLQLADGVFAEPRAWEYLLVPGDRLKPKDGKYLIQMTEELWEATYLDRMELIAVDHPADVEVFSNEKVGPPELAEFKIHTVRERKMPLAARDKHGRDVFDAIAREDGVFMKGFDAAPRRGLTDEHFLELDMGPLPHSQRLTLFLTGWLYPASTSLRLGVSHDPGAPAPRPPALEVPDEHGNWQEVRPFMGFPGGRTKTIAVDLSGIFLTDDHRLRIVTNMEFYWDAAFFSTGEERAPCELTMLPVALANLHYRGFSRVLDNPGFGPPGYDYNSVSTAPRWAPMFGRFTRYGDVTELLHAEDDRQVIFGSGDELTVAFEVPEKGPRAGWKRDFLLHNVGWDKDNDLNVVTSQQVEPLPFQAMSGYPYRADEQYPDSPRHREYLRKYQTREQFPMSFWRQVQQFEPRVSHE
jgi:hypothetical protein